MTSRKVLLSLVLFSLIASLPVAAQVKSAKDLPPKYKKWLMEEVVYIIAPKEKDVFLQLSNDREREIFIEAFWNARNPNPGSVENEYKKEHYRRIDYANLWFNRGSEAGGWRTDMGRMYIILGEPKQIESFENDQQLYPTIIWFYEGMGDLGLPNAFNIVFFKKYGAGDYILFSPVRDGPQHLMPNYNGDMSDYTSAYSKLMDYEPEVAEISLTLVPNDYFIGMAPSVSSDVLIQNKIPASAYNKVKSEYAEKLLKYKDVIDVEYTANYISNDALVQIYRDASGRAFVHYLLEPAKLTIEEVNGAYRTILNINGIVSDASGKMVYQFDRSIPVEFDSAQFAKIRNRTVSFQDAFPLVDGEYKFSLLWKNTVSKEFTSVEAALKVPPARSLTMSSPLLANRIIRNPEFAKRTKPFTTAGLQLLASPRNDFVISDTMSIYLQFDGLTDEIRKNGSLAFTILKDDKPFKSFTKALKDYADPVHVVEDIPLATYQPAYYTLKTALLDAKQTELVSGKSMFFVSFNPVVPRPWVLYGPLPAPGDPSYDNAVGMQYFHLDDLAKARPLLEDAYKRRPDSVEFALDYCRALMKAKDFTGVQKAVAPFYPDQKNYEFAQILGEASQALGDYAHAIIYYKDYLQYYGTNLVVLNDIGECYFKTGDIPQALIAWKKSLVINPKQDDLRKRVEGLENKARQK